MVDGTDVITDLPTMLTAQRPYNRKSAREDWCGRAEWKLWTKDRIATAVVEGVMMTKRRGASLSPLKQFHAVICSSTSVIFSVVLIL
jgi:hypothetical protein